MRRELGAGCGRVWLVGAGPGDPGLITVRGLQLLRSAEVVIHDRLSPPELLAEVGPGTTVIDAGKAPGRHRLEQRDIEALLVGHARAGRRVVRLKGGDPFLFGRGWEELAACRAAGVPCEVVPGVSSALAAPAAVGIPVTARGISRSVSIVTPRRGEDTPDAPGRPAGGDTLVVLMGVEALPRLVVDLLREGRPPETPAAVVSWATTPRQRSVQATLQSLVEAVAAAGLESPAVIVVGEVAALAEPQASPLPRRQPWAEAHVPDPATLAARA